MIYILHILYLIIIFFSITLKKYFLILHLKFRQMTISLNKRRELRSNLRSLQQELTKVSMERNSLSQEHSKRMYVNFLLILKKLI